MFSSVGAGDGSIVYTHTLKNIICSIGKGSCSFRSPPGFLVDDHQNPIRFKRIISACKCIADIKPTKFTGSHETENLSVGKELDDESHVLIECRNVYKSFREKHILRGVSFKVVPLSFPCLCASIVFHQFLHVSHDDIMIRHGEAVGIIGPSGTGKSTILKIMAGLLAPDKVFHSAAPFDSLTVRENFGFFLYENSTMPEDQIEELVTDTLAAIGLKVLLYDEPTAGLDPIASTVVEDLIRFVHIKGKDALGKPGKIASYVIVTHQHSTTRRAVDSLHLGAWMDPLDISKLRQHTEYGFLNTNFFIFQVIFYDN